MKILHIPSGTFCSYVIYDSCAIISTSLDAPCTNITKDIFDFLWQKQYIIFFGFLDNPKNMIIYGNHPNKDKINKGIEILQNEFTLI